MCNKSRVYGRAIALLILLGPARSSRRACCVLQPTPAPGQSGIAMPKRSTRSREEPAEAADEKAAKKRKADAPKKAEAAGALEAVNKAPEVRAPCSRAALCTPAQQTTVYKM